MVGLMADGQLMDGNCTPQGEEVPGTVPVTRGRDTQTVPESGRDKSRLRWYTNQLLLL